MEITQVRIFPVEEEKLKAFVSIIIDECFVVSDIKIIQGTQGLFVSMPSKRRKNGTFRDIAHPLNNETRRRFEEQIIAKFREIVEESGGSVSASLRALEAEGTFVAMNNRVSQSVPHLHVHVVPRRKGDGLRGFFWPRRSYEDERHAAQVQRAIRDAVVRITEVLRP